MDDALPYLSPPAPATGVHSVEVDGELVLYQQATGRVARLDRLGSIIWPFLDGGTTVAELSEDLADAFAVPVTDVRADLEALLDGLARRGFLQAASPPTPAVVAAADSPFLGNPPDP